jgi:aminopeptidase N
VLELNQTRQSFAFDNLATRPIPSILRDFSAPVIVEREQTATERAFLLAHDTDPFNKWEAGRTLAKEVMARMVTDGADPAADWLDALAQVAQDDSLDPAFRALALRLPGEDDMAQTLHAAGHVPDPQAIYTARRRMAAALANRLSQLLAPMVAALQDTGPFVSDAKSSGRRALKLAALSYLTLLDDGKAASAAFASADNMSDQQGALSALLDTGHGQPELDRFAARWSDDRLVMDKWFALQVAYAAPDATFDTADRLTKHVAFDWKNPNRFRSVIGALSGNHAGFHHASGTSYRLLADWLIKLDPINPQTAARMSTAFESWSRYDADRQALMKTELTRIGKSPGLSRNLGEMVTRMLGAAPQ